MRMSRKLFENSIAAQCTTNPKRFWAHVRASYASKSRVTSIFDANGVMSINDENTADIFNNYFASVFNIVHDSIPDISTPARSSSTLNTFSVSLKEVSRVIKSVPAYSSPGPDGISNILLKQGGSFLLLLVYDLFSLILSTETLPAEWKKAVVVPIFKKGR